MNLIFTSDEMKIMEIDMTSWVLFPKTSFHKSVQTTFIKSETCF